jgi:hypothetical protein
VARERRRTDPPNSATARRHTPHRRRRRPSRVVVIVVAAAAAAAQIVRHYLFGAFGVDFISSLPFGAFSLRGFPGAAYCRRCVSLRDCALILLRPHHR